MDNKRQFLNYLRTLNLDKKIYFCYLLKDELDKILIETDEIIEINNNAELVYFRCYFYLSLLIMHNPEIVKFSYNVEFIEKINEIKNRTNKILKKIIFSKIILILTYNLKEIIDDENQNIINHIISIENENRTFIQNNINIFEDFDLNLNLNEFEKKNIDEIYMEILYGLIRTLKFNDEEYEYAKQIMCDQLEIESITITKKMREQFLRVLNYDENCVKQFIISKISDLFNKNKINFHYFLIKYILKEELYIFEIPFFLNLKVYITRIMNNKKSKNILYNYQFDNIIIKKRMEYIIKIISKDCYHEYFQSILDKLPIILEYYEFNNINNIYYNTIIKIKEIINNNSGYYEEFLLDYNLALPLHNKLSKIKEKLEENKIEINIHLLKYFLSNYDIYINDFHFFYYLFLLNNLFDNSIFVLNLSNNNLFEYKITNINNIFSNQNGINYKILYEIKENEKFKEHTLLIKNLEKLLFFLNEIKYSFEKERIIYNLNLNLKLKKESKDMNNNIYNLSCIYSLMENPTLIAKDDNILNKNNIGKGFQYFLENLKLKYKNLIKSNSIDIKNHIFGKMEILGNYEENEINIIKLNNKDCLLIGISFLPEKIKNENNISSRKLFSYSNDNMNLFELKDIESTIIKIEKSFFCLLENNDKFILFKTNGVVQCNKDKENEEIIINKRCEGGIIRNTKELIALSHCAENNDQDSMLIYDIETKKQIKKPIIFPKGITFNNASLFLINNIFICSSINEINYNNYGIYILNLENNKYKIIQENEFKINCFCPLLCSKNINNSKNMNVFIAGGEEDNKGKISLYEIEYNNEKEDINIIKIFEKKMENIKCINHLNYSYKNNTILIASSDGVIYKTDIINL